MSYKIGVPRIDKSLGGVAEGTNLLVKGNPVSGRRNFVGRVVSEGVDNGEGTVYVTTDDPADGILERYTWGSGADAFGVVDCVTESQGVGDTRLPDDMVKFVGSPSDMTGVGVKVSSLLSEFRDERGIEHNRVFVDSVSTLLMYSDLETVFRFLHVFTGRIRSMDGFGVFVVDSAMHGEKEYSTLRQLFDGIVEVETADDGGGVRARLVGLEDEPTEWVALE